MNITTTTKKRVACFAGIVLGATLLIGGTGASMIEMVAPPTASKISNSEVAWKIDLTGAKALDADLTPGSPVAALDLTAKNSGTLPANVALSTDQLTLDGIDLTTPLISQASATVKMQVNGDSSRELTWHGGLAVLLTNASVMDQLVAPGDTVTVHVEVTPISTDRVDASAPVSASTHAFKMGLLFAQGSADEAGQLLTAAQSRGARLDPNADGDGGWLVNAKNLS